MSYAASTGTYASLIGISWFVSEDSKGNAYIGDANIIFEHILKLNPDTCSADQFIRGLLMSRYVDDKGAKKSFTQSQLADLCLRRSFPGWPTTSKGVQAKVKQIVEQLKAGRDNFKDDGVSQRSKNIPTLVNYKQEQFDLIAECRNSDLEGLTLDDIVENIRKEMGL